MTLHLKPPSSSTHHVVLVDREPHPDVFAPRGRRIIESPHWTLECSVFSGGHVIRFHRQDMTAWEILCSESAVACAPPALATVPAVGDRDFEYAFERHKIVYMHTLQSESLAENVYDDELQAQVDQARSNASTTLVHRYRDEAGHCLSMLEFQRYPKQVHVHAYHFMASGGQTLRTQTLFELV